MPIVRQHDVGLCCSSKTSQSLVPTHNLIFSPHLDHGYAIELASYIITDTSQEADNILKKYFAAGDLDVVKSEYHTGADRGLRNHHC